MANCKLTVVDLPATTVPPCFLRSGLWTPGRHVGGYCLSGLGLLDLPVFTAGGGLTYVLEPGFGYLAGLFRLPG